MTTIKTTVFAALLAASTLLATGTANAAGVDGLSVTPRVSTLGPGLEFKYTFHEKFNGRFVFNQYDRDFSENQFRQQIRRDFGVEQLRLDWRLASAGQWLSAERRLVFQRQ